MFLSELHELLPSKLFSKRLAEVISSLLETVGEQELDFGDITIRGQNPTVLYFTTLGGAIEDSDAMRDAKAYMKKMKALTIKAFRDAKIQVPEVDVRLGTDMAGDAEVTTTCTWKWSSPEPELNAAAFRSGLSAEDEVEVDL